MFGLCFHVTEQAYDKTVFDEEFSGIEANQVTDAKIPAESAKQEVELANATHENSAA